MAKIHEEKQSEREYKVRSGSNELKEFAAHMLEQRIQEEEKRQLQLLKERLINRKELKTIKNTKFELEQIINSGTPEEVASAIVAEKEYRRMKLNPPISFSKEDKKRVIERMNKEGNSSLVSAYVKVYSDLDKYQDSLYKSCKVYQISLGDLSKYTTLWDEYDRMAKVLTTLIAEKGLSKEQIIEELNRISPMIQNSKVSYSYNEEKKIIEADIFQKGQLYEFITEAAEETEDFLSLVKACITVIEEYISENGYYFIMPVIMDETIQLVKEEAYSHSVINDKYHKSRVNEIFKSGGIVTEKEMKLAVVPDYEELIPKQNHIDICRNGLKEIRESSPYR